MIQAFFCSAGNSRATNPGEAVHVNTTFTARKLDMSCPESLIFLAVKYVREFRDLSLND